MSKEQDNSAGHPIESFLASVENKLMDNHHKRLLRAARKEDPAAAVESELQTIIQEIIDEN